MSDIEPMTFEQVEDCFPEGLFSSKDGGFNVSAQWLHDFAHSVERAAILADREKRAQAAQPLLERIRELEALLTGSNKAVDALAERLNATEASKPVQACDHQYHYFGDQQKRRRCNRCNELEPVQECCSQHTEAPTASNEREALHTVLDRFEAKERGIPQAHIAAQLVTELRAALATKQEAQPTCMCGHPEILNTVHRVGTPCWRAADPVEGLVSPAQAAQPVQEDALNTLCKMLHSGEEVEGDDGLAMLVPMDLWNEAQEAIELLVGEDDDTEFSKPVQAEAPHVTVRLPGITAKQAAAVSIALCEALVDAGREFGIVLIGEQAEAPSDDADPLTLEQEEWVMDLAEKHNLGRRVPQIGALRGVAPDVFYTDASYRTHELFCFAAELLAAKQAGREPVASIYVSPNGEREFDDWGHDLPVGRNELCLATKQAEAPTASNEREELLRGEVDAITELNHAQWLALENVRTLAARNRKEEWAQHLLRWCEEAGNASRTLRAALATQQEAQPQAEPAGGDKEDAERIKQGNKDAD